MHICGALLTEPVAPALRAVQRFHTHKLLRSKFMAYVHRLIECMGPAMVPHLSAVLWTLHQAGGDAADACDALNLLGQVVTNRIPIRTESAPERIVILY